MTVKSETWAIINSNSANNNSISGGSWFLSPFWAKTTAKNLTTMQMGLRQQRESKRGRVWERAWDREREPEWERKSARESERESEEKLLHALFPPYACMLCHLLHIVTVWCDTEQTSGEEQELMLLYTLHTDAYFRSTLHGAGQLYANPEKKDNITSWNVNICKHFWAFVCYTKMCQSVLWYFSLSLLIWHDMIRPWVYFSSIVRLLMQRRLGPLTRRSCLPLGWNPRWTALFFFFFWCMCQNYCFFYEAVRLRACF